MVSMWGNRYECANFSSFFFIEQEFCFSILRDREETKKVYSMCVPGQNEHKSVTFRFDFVFFLSLSHSFAKLQTRKRAATK